MSAPPAWAVVPASTVDSEALRRHLIATWGDETVAAGGELRDHSSIAASPPWPRAASSDTWPTNQRRGYRLVAVRPGAVDEARRTLKPSIPVVGDHGIPMRDELELE